MRKVLLTALTAALLLTVFAASALAEAPPIIRSCGFLFRG